MKPEKSLLYFLNIVAIIAYSMSVQAQQRGFKKINLIIDGQTTTLYSGSHALVIGVSDYTEGWQDLYGVKNDISCVKSALEKQDFNVVVVENPTSVALKNAFDDFISKYGRVLDNRLLIYFSGHGHTLKTGWGGDMGYIVPSDAPDPNINPDVFKDKAIDMETMEVYAKKIDSKHALFMFDCCFSGSVFSMSKAAPAFISYKTREPVRQFITAGTAEEEVPDKSIFCREFVEALNGPGDINGDGYLTGSELGEYLQTKVINYSEEAQHPQYGKIRNPNLDKGDFVFVLENQPAAAGNQNSIKISEEPVISLSSGNIELSCEISGALFMDSTFYRNVSKGTRVTLSDVASGMHTLKIEGAEPWQDTVLVAENITSVVNAKSTKPNIRNYEWEPVMVLVKGGSFTMGCSIEQTDCSNDEKPARQVTVSDFFIGKYEVTQSLWREVMGTNPSNFGNCDNCPVEKVSWENAQEFIKKINLRTGKNYRLPSEAEWEYAARGGNESKGYKYAGSNNLVDVGWFWANSGDTYLSGSWDSDRIMKNNCKTHPVGQHKANELGLFDMSGNVWEWCSDWYGSYKSSSPTDPQGLSSGSTRVLRGGSWFNFPEDCRVSYRYCFNPLGRGGDYGFRLVLIK